MQNAIDLFECVWESIEAAGALVQRPQWPLKEQDGQSARLLSALENFPVGRYLETSLANAKKQGLESIAALIRQSVGLLVWSQNSTYTQATLGAHFMDNYVFGLLTGPGTPLAPEVPPSGFLLLGPNTEYPGHGHEPREIYLVLTPGAEWCLDRKDWFPVAPGEVIYHAPHQVHAMRTQAKPMLAFAAWLDDGNRNAISI